MSSLGTNVGLDCYVHCPVYQGCRLVIIVVWLRSDGSSTGQQRYDEDASHDVCGRKECGIVACNERGEGQRLEDRDRMEISAQRQVRASIVSRLERRSSKVNLNTTSGMPRPQRQRLFTPETQLLARPGRISDRACRQYFGRNVTCAIFAGHA